MRKASSRSTGGQSCRASSSSTGRPTATAKIAEWLGERLRAQARALETPARQIAENSVRLALENAVSVAGVLLLTEATMTEVREDKKEAVPAGADAL
jgi:hypothetical protein